MKQQEIESVTVRPFVEVYRPEYPKKAHLVRSVAADRQQYQQRAKGRNTITVQHIHLTKTHTETVAHARSTYFSLTTTIDYK